MTLLILGNKSTEHEVLHAESQPEEALRGIEGGWCGQERSKLRDLQDV